MYTLKQLRRLRWLVLITVLVGIAASIAMNVLHAPPSLVARIASGIPPAAVFGSLELIARIPGSGKWLTRARVFGASIVALGAASISYAQQRAAVHDLGFAMWEAWIWPAVIDGFMIVASVSLVEVVHKIRELTAEPAGAAKPQTHTRVAVDLHETPEALAYRAAQAQRLRNESSLVGLNGNKPALAGPAES
jgi:hypothetical protein